MEFKAHVRALAATGGLAALLGWAEPAAATTMIELSVNQLVDASSLVARGTVREVWTELDERGTVWTRAQVELDHVYKGDAETAAVVVSQLGGTYGSRTAHIEGVARFSVGEEGVFFLQETRSGRVVPVGMVQGKYTIALDPYSREEIVMRRTAPYRRSYDHRFLPHPARGTATTLATLEEAIERRVSEGWDGKPIPGMSLDRLSEINAVEVR